MPDNASIDSRAAQPTQGAALGAASAAAPRRGAAGAAGTVVAAGAAGGLCAAVVAALARPAGLAGGRGGGAGRRRPAAGAPAGPRVERRRAQALGRLCAASARRRCRRCAARRAAPTAGAPRTSGTPARPAARGRQSRASAACAREVERALGERERRWQARMRLSADWHWETDAELRFSLGLARPGVAGQARRAAGRPGRPPHRRGAAVRSRRKGAGRRWSRAHGAAQAAARSVLEVRRPGGCRCGWRSTAARTATSRASLPATKASAATSPNSAWPTCAWPKANAATR